MDAPRTQYVTTTDGVAIGFAVSGAGPYLYSLPAPPDNHIELEWALPERRASVERVGRYRTVVRFDGRGTGVSDRHVDDYSLAARLRDFEAVLQRLGRPEGAIITGRHGAQLAVAAAAAHPQLITHLILVNPFIRGEEFMSHDKLDMWRTMLTTDYRMFTEAIGAEMFGWGRQEGTRFGQFFRDAVTADAALRIYNAMIEVDLTELLGAVTCPVLIIRTQDSGLMNPSSVRRFAAHLPNATVTYTPGAPTESADEDMARIVGEFFGEEWADLEVDVPLPPPPAPPIGGLRTLLFTDLEGHSAMMSRLGDVRGREVLREHERLTRDALALHAGDEVKTLGDGFMASFGSAQRAIECAIALQRAVSRSELLSTFGLRVRIGLNAGEPIEEDDDLFGTSVIAAARIAASATGGEVLVANVVRELVAGKGFLFSDRGAIPLKGLDEPVRVWELNWDPAL